LYDAALSESPTSSSPQLFPYPTLFRSAPARSRRSPLRRRGRDRGGEEIPKPLEGGLPVAELRSLLRNREAALERLRDLLAAAIAPPPPKRRTTRASRGRSEERRVGEELGRAGGRRLGESSIIE